MEEKGMKTFLVRMLLLKSIWVSKAAPKFKWRLQTYAGSTLGQHVAKPGIDAFNIAANGEMEIALYYADELVPQGELIKAMQRGVVDAVQTDEDSAQAPVGLPVFGGSVPA